MIGIAIVTVGINQLVEHRVSHRKVADSHSITILVMRCCVFQKNNLPLLSNETKQPTRYGGSY